jgi:hypothetical protein
MKLVVHIYDVVENLMVLWSELCKNINRLAMQWNDKSQYVTKEPVMNTILYVV